MRRTLSLIAFGLALLGSTGFAQLDADTENPTVCVSTRNFGPVRADDYCVHVRNPVGPVYIP